MYAHALGEKDEEEIFDGEAADRDFEDDDYDVQDQSCRVSTWGRFSKNASPKRKNEEKSV